MGWHVWFNPITRGRWSYSPCCFLLVTYVKLIFFAEIWWLLIFIFLTGAVKISSQNMSYMEAINVLLENVSSMKILIFSLFFVFEMIKNDSMLIIFVKKSAYKMKECSSFHYSLILDEKILTDRTIYILQKKKIFLYFSFPSS